MSDRAKAIFRSPEEKKQLVAKVLDAAKNQGMSIEAACKHCGIRVNQYYEWRKLVSKPGRPKGSKTQKKLKAKPDATLPALAGFKPNPKNPTSYVADETTMIPGDATVDKALDLMRGQLAILNRLMGAV